MRKRKVLIALLALCCTGMLAFGACGGNTGDGTGGSSPSASDEVGALTLDQTEVVLDLYAEMRLTVTSGEADVEWESSDPDILTVEDGLISAQGVKGDVTVTARSGNKEAVCAVRVVNQGASVRLAAEALRAFVNVESAPKLYVRYAGKEYPVTEEATIVVADSSVATVNDGKIVGVKEGSTTANVSCTWKGKALKTTLDIEVFPAQSMIFTQTEYNVYAVNESSAVKSRTAKIEAEVYDAGEKQEDRTIALAFKDPADEAYLAISGDTVTAKETDVIRAVTLNVINNDTDVTLTGEITVNIHPNHLSRPETEFAKSGKIDAVIYEESAETVGGRTGVYKYATPTGCENLNNLAWTKWNAQIELSTTRSVGSETKYEFIREEGYRLAAFDVYYTGDKGFSAGRTGISNYFYVDSAFNDDSILLVNAAGEATNVLKKNEWMTLYFDLDKVYADANSGTDCSLYILNCYVGDVTYISDVRYYYDDAPIAGLVENSEIDSAERRITADETNENKGNAGLNEFIATSPVYVDFKEETLDGETVMSYKRNAIENAYDVETRTKISPVHDLNGKANIAGYRYVAFDFRLLSGEPILKIYNTATKAKDAASLKAGVKISHENVTLYKGGETVDTIAAGEWYTLVLRIDGQTKDNSYIYALDESTQFHIKNVAYFKNTSFKYEYGYNRLLSAEADDRDIAFVGDEYEISDLLRVTYKGEKVTDYTVSETIVYTDGVLEVNAEKTALRVIGTGESKVTFVVSRGNDTAYVTFRISTNGRDCILLVDDTFEIRYDETVTQRVTVSPYAYEDGAAVDGTRVFLRVKEGGDYVQTDGFKVTAKAVGKAILEVYYEKEDGEEVVKEVTVNVWNDYLGRGGEELVWTAKTDGASYEKTDSYAGRENVWKYTVNDSNVWSNKLEVGETSVGGLEGRNEDSIIARTNMKDRGFTTVSLDVCVASGSLDIRSTVPDASSLAANQSHYGVTLAADGNVTNVNPNIAVYNANGVTATYINANEWYTVVVRYMNPEEGLGAGYLASIQICKNKGEFYFDNVRYYTNDTWKETFATGAEVSCPATVMLGEATPLSSTVSILGENTAHTLTLKDNANGAAALSDGKLTFSVKGTHTVTVTLTAGGYSFDRKLTVTVGKAYDEFDGADAFVLKSGATATMTVETTDPTASGRTNVVKYNTGAVGWWANRLLLLNLTEENPAYEGNKTLVANALRAENYQYVAIDFYLSSGSNTCALYYPDGTSAGASFNLATNGTAANAVPESEVIKFYKDGVLLTTSDTIAKGVWYTVVIDLSGALNASNPNVSFNGTVNNTWYFDNVRYYRNDSWQDDYTA